MHTLSERNYFLVVDCFIEPVTAACTDVWHCNRVFTYFQIKKSLSGMWLSQIPGLNEVRETSISKLLTQAKICSLYSKQIRFLSSYSAMIIGSLRCATLRRAGGKRAGVFEPFSHAIAWNFFAETNLLCLHLSISIVFPLPTLP